MQLSIEPQQRTTPQCTETVLDQDWFRIRKMILEQMQKSGVCWLHRIRVTITAEGVTMQGRVKSFYHRQLCIDSVRRVATVNFIDLLQVDPPVSVTNENQCDCFGDADRVPTKSLFLVRPA